MAVGRPRDVVAHLSADDELAAHGTLRSAGPDGVVIVKNECGRETHVEVDPWSDAFARRYVARYPQVDRLRNPSGVEIVLYPTTSIAGPIPNKPPSFVVRDWRQGHAAVRRLATPGGYSHADAGEGPRDVVQGPSIA